MKAMISQPVGFKTEKEIIETWDRAAKHLESMGYEVIDNIFADEWYKNIDIKDTELCFLAKSLENMSFCDVVYFCKGWEDDRRCIIENDAAIVYKIGTLYECIDEKIKEVRLQRDRLEQRKRMIDATSITNIREE